MAEVLLTTKLETKLLEPLTSSNDTVTVPLETASNVVMRAWDESVIPSRQALSAEAYIVKLTDTIRTVALECNRQEGVSQSLADANVRQTKIISKLRDDIYTLKVQLAKVNEPPRDATDL